MSETVKEDPGIPPDPYRMVYIIFYWLGVGTLLPWNFFISVPGKVLSIVLSRIDFCKVGF